MENRLELQFDNSLTALAGFDYGQEIYEKQAKEKIDIEKVNVIVFPKNIEIVASSFIQGFLCPLMEDYGVEKVKNMIKIESLSEELTNYILESIY